MQKWLVSVLFLLSWNPLFSQIKKDFQIWNYNNLYGQLNRHVDLFANIEFRYRDNGTTFYYNHEHIELPIHVCSFIDVGPSYRQDFSLPAGSTNQWTTRYIPNLNLTFFWSVHDLHFSDRSRVAYIIHRNNTPDQWQYRNKLFVYKVIKQSPNEIRLFVDDEIFFMQHVNGLSQNRTSIGLNFALFKKITMDIGYRYRILKRPYGWDHDNILLLNAYVFF